jgi:hypothetical protein
MFGVDFWAKLEKYCKGPEESTVFLHQVPLFLDHGVPDQCDNPAEFLCNPWVLIQLPWHPVILHQWLLAVFAEFIRFQTELFSLCSLMMPKQLQPLSMKLVALMHKTETLISCGFSLIGLQIKSEKTVDFEIVKCVLENIVLPLIPIINFLVAEKTRVMFGNLKRMACSNLQELDGYGYYFKMRDMLFCHTGTLYDLTATVESFEDLLGRTKGGFQEVVNRLSKDYSVSGLKPTVVTDLKTQLQSDEEEPSKHLEEWKEPETGFQQFVATYTKKYFNCQDLDLSKESVTADSGGRDLFYYYTTAKQLDILNRSGEGFTGFMISIKNLELVKVKTALEALVTIDACTMMTNQEKEIISTYQLDCEVEELTLDEMEEMLKEVETCVVSRDDLKELLKADMKTSTHLENASADLNQNFEVLIISSISWISTLFCHIADIFCRLK